jgi:hypothetical protein
MWKNIRMKVVFLVLMALCTAQIAAAGWFDQAVDNAKQRVGTRAVDETADGAYNTTKDAVLNKDKGGSKGTSRSSDDSSLSDMEHQRPAAGADGEAIDDDHFIQKDDYFVADHPLDKESYIYVTLSKMVTEPSELTKSEAEFFKISDGSNMWSKHFYQTRIIQKGELKLGTKVIIFEGHRRENGIYFAPEKKEEARGSAWFLAKVTDVSDLYRGYVTVSGNYKVSPKNLRIILPKTTGTMR